MLIRVVIVLFILIVSLQTFAQTISDSGVPVYDGPESRMFLKTWLMLDPIDVNLVQNVTFTNQKNPRNINLRSQFAFALDFLSEVGGEAKVQPSAGNRVAIAGASSVWRVQTSQSDRINFNDLFGRQEYAFVYAYAEVNVKEPTQMVIGIGSDDMCKIRLNGKEVYSYTNGRANNVDDDYVFVDLIEGKNTILLKILNQERDWGFTCRFLSKDDVSDMELIEMQFDSMPQESFNQLAVIIGGVVLTTFLLLTLLLFLAKSNRKF